MQIDHITDHHRILCMAQYLFAVQAKNRLKQTGLLRRFSISCYGNQPTLEDIRAEKTTKYRELENNKGSKEFKERFLRYIPDKQKKCPTIKKRHKKKRRKRGKTAYRQKHKYYWQ